MALLNQFAVRGVEERVVEALHDALRGSAIHCAISIRMPVDKLLGLGDLLAVPLVGLVEGFKICGDSERAVDFRVFRGEIWLVEIVSVGHVRPMDG